MADKTVFGASGNRPRVRAVSKEIEEGRTKITLRHTMPEKVVEREATRQGWNEMLDRLAELVTK